MAFNLGRLKTSFACTKNQKIFRQVDFTLVMVAVTTLQNSFCSVVFVVSLFAQKDAWAKMTWNSWLSCS